MSAGLAIKEFTVDTSSLTPTEHQVVTELIQAAKIIASIYALQENKALPGGNYYPANASKEEIEHAAQSDPKILDPFTMVERDVDGTLQAIPYHVKFADQLKQVVEHLQNAANLTDNPEFAKRLKLQAKALLDGSYDESDSFWLTMEPYKIDIVIGPLERYEDKLFFKKCAYQAWVGINNEQETQGLAVLQRTIYQAQRRALAPIAKVEYADKLQVRVDDTFIFSGLIATFMFTTTNLPNDPNLVEKYGTKITLFRPVVEYRFFARRIPILKNIFERKFQDNYPSALLLEASFRNALLHEIAHPLTRYRDAEDRLKELFPVFDELLASLYGIKACGTLLLKDAMQQKEFEALLVIYICAAFDWWLEYQEDEVVSDYTRGYAMAMNYFMQAGAIVENDGVSWPNFMKLYVATEELVTILERIVAFGTYENATTFLEKFGSFAIFHRLDKRLKTFQEEMHNGYKH